MRYLATQGEREAAARRLPLMSFKGIGEIYPNDKGDDFLTPSPRLIIRMSFPTGYSLTGCSPALPVSASPAGADHASGLSQLRGIFNDRQRTIALKIKTVYKLLNSRPRGG